jgi:hypothetical protein
MDTEPVNSDATLQSRAFTAGGFIPAPAQSDGDSIPALLAGCDYIIPACLATRLEGDSR